MIHLRNSAQHTVLIIFEKNTRLHKKNPGKSGKIRENPGKSGKCTEKIGKIGQK
jgi:hypothetical protein